MMHQEDFLRDLCHSKVVGNFPPFNTGDINEVKTYIRKIIDKIKVNHQLIVEPDFNDYGSGFASYINVRVSKQDESDSQIIQNKNESTKNTKGILLYVSVLTPYWFYGGSEWSITTKNGEFKSSFSGFLSPESINDIDKGLWAAPIRKIKEIFDLYHYTLLTREELEEPVLFDVDIQTVLADKPYTVFDCFFYWED